MSTSEKKVLANRINGQKSHGPTNTTSTRFNATKHGLLAAGITELDDAEGYRALLKDLTEEKAPVGAVEMLLVESAALDMVRWRRARRLEAEYLTSQMNPPIHEPGLLGVKIDLHQGAMLDPGISAPISNDCAEQLVRVYQRYESVFAYRLFRTLHELERLQRMRKGETLPAPATVDVSIHADPGTVDSVPAASGQPKTLAGGER